MRKLKNILDDGLDKIFQIFPSPLDLIVFPTAIVIGVSSLLVGGHYIWRESQETDIVPRIQTRKVIGKSLPDKFYEINGKKVYLEIDGKSVEDYFQNNSN